MKPSFQFFVLNRRWMEIWSLQALVSGAVKALMIISQKRRRT